MDFGNVARDAIVERYLTVRSVSEVIVEASHMRLELREDDCLCLYFANLLSDDLLNIFSDDSKLLLNDRHVHRMANNFRLLLLDGDGLGDTDEVVGTIEVVEVIEGVETSPGVEAVRITAHEVGGSCECTSKDGSGEEWHLEHGSMEIAVWNGSNGLNECFERIDCCSATRAGPTGAERTKRLLGLSKG